MPVFGSKLRHERMLAIGNELAKSQYDFVLLQEVSIHEYMCAYVSCAASLGQKLCTTRSKLYFITTIAMWD